MFFKRIGQTGMIMFLTVGFVIALTIPETNTIGVTERSATGAEKKSAPIDVVQDIEDGYVETA